MKIYKDFDEFFGTLEQDVMVVKLFGEEYEIPASINAKIALKLARMAKDDPNKQMDATDIQDFLEAIYGVETIEEWLDHGISIAQLSEVLTWTMSQYGQAKVAVPDNKKKAVPRKRR